jgi:hypothetical protein
LEFIQQIINDTDGKLIFDGQFIQGTYAKYLLSLRPSPLVKNMGWYCGKLAPPLMIQVPSFIFHFSKKMDIFRDVHWGLDCPQGEGCYDHAHP